MGEIVDLEKYRRRRGRKTIESLGARDRRAAAPRKPGREQTRTAADAGKSGSSGADEAAKIEREDHKAE